MNVIKKGLQGIWYYFWGHIFAFFFYDKKYLTGRWFEGKLGGICATGWKWVTKDAISRMFSLYNREAKFPVGQGCRIVNPSNIVFDPNDLNNFHSFGIYYQAIGNISIGKGTYIAPNCGLITANHDVNNLEFHSDIKSIKIGKECWIGMNSVIMPGVELGDKTIVGAGSVVTKSFRSGHCIIVGSPARIIKELE